MTFVDDERVRRLVELAAEPEVIADRFELGMSLGEGGMGVVFEAWDREARRTVALKLLRDGAGDNARLAVGADPATGARFEREAAALAKLSHPGIVGYVAHGRTPHGERYLVMERLVGLTLAERLARGPLGVAGAAQVGHCIAAALAAAHAHGLVHRDLKPSNIFLRDGASARATLLDFGLARAAQGPSVTQAGALVGTPSYMAPEQVRGAAIADARGDLFALGAVLFECLTGRAPFVGADTEAVLTKILVEQPPAIAPLCPSVPPAFEALIARLLAKDPKHRPAGAAEVASELAAILSQPLAELEDAPPVIGAGSAAALAATQAAQQGALIAGKYRVVRTLGSGGMGIVLLARHDALDRHVAIKLLRRSEQTGEPGLPGRGVGRLVREARAVSRLESEHVARVMDVDVLEDGAPFIVMEFLAGKDLAQVLARDGRLPVAVAVDYVLQASKALAEAHALGIVHRDLKPSNLFLTTRRDGSPLIKVLDFGISKVSPPSDAAPPEALPLEASITAPDAILGSPLYMSPEQLQSARHVDARTDIWSLGVVLHELLTGHPPFTADSYLAIAARVAGGAPADLRAACPEAPAGLAAVVRRCLEKDPAQRFQSVGELAQALAPFDAGNSAVSRKRRRGLALGLGAGVVAVGAVAALLVARGLGAGGGADAPAAGSSRLPAAASSGLPAATSSSLAAATSSSSVAAPGLVAAAEPDAGASSAPRDSSASSTSSAAATPDESPSPRASSSSSSPAPPARSSPPPPGARALARDSARRATLARERAPAAPATAGSRPAATRPAAGAQSAAGARPAEKPEPVDALDPMNPALLKR